MATLIAKNEDLKKVADAIRAKTGKAEQLVFPDGFASEIEGITTGGGGGEDTFNQFLSDTLEAVNSTDSLAFRTAYFKDKTALKTVYLPNATGMIESLFGGCRNLKSVVMKDFTSNTYGHVLPASTFSNCSSLETVHGIENVRVLMNNAFYNCSKLNLQTIPDVSAIFDYTFRYCTSLIIKKIPQRTDAIYNYAFEGCTGLTKLFIPVGTKSTYRIDSGAFSDCANLTDVYTDATEKPAKWAANAFPSTTTIHYGVSEADFDAILVAEE